MSAVTSDPGAAALEALTHDLYKLQALLAEEYEAIRSRKAERIESIAQSKHALVGELNRLAQAASAHISQVLGDTTNSDGATVRELLNDCELANRRNGQAIETSQSFTRNLLDIFRGRRPGQGTYTADGKPGDTNDGGTLFRI